MARGVSSLAGEDKDTSPLTSAAFLKNCRTKLPQKIDFRTLIKAQLILPYV
jgi:hypothetical protein